jgi:hypothetical protein
MEGVRSSAAGDSDVDFFQSAGSRMLGYHVSIYRQRDGGASRATAESPGGARLAVWETGIGGLDWLVELEKAGKALFLGGNGYPFRYTATAEHLLPEINDVTRGVQNTWLLGESDIVTEKWEGKNVVDGDAVAACRPDEWLLVEGWDLS